MIDLKTIRQDPELVRASQRRRGAPESLVDEVLAADAANREALTRFESLRAEQKSMGKSVASAKGEDRDALLARAKELAQQVKEAQAQADEAAAQVTELARRIDNIVLDGVPSGGEDDYVVLREVGDIRDFAAEGFAPADHVELGESLKLIDTERGAKVSGARFYYLTGMGARLELALLNLAVDRALAHNFTPMITPTLVRPEVMAGTGFLGEHSAEIYRLEADDLYLVGTSEVALAGYHSGEIIDLSAGPKRYAGWSACYRREAGSYGKDTRGIIRVHQFHKVEMFSYVQPEQAAEEHAKLLSYEEEMLNLLGLPYRVIDTAAGDLGSSAARKFDCEAWLPSQQRWLELSSTSNCTTFQARRLAIRYRDENGQSQTAATLNGTLATTRWIVALLETHQQADGSVKIPEVLRPYLGGIPEISV